MNPSKLHFILTGFREEAGFRVFTFEGVGSDRSRTQVTVRTDLSLIRRYGIGLQELPLLCRGLLDRCGLSGEDRVFVYGEDEMSLHSREAAARAEAAKQRKIARRAPAPTG